MAIFSEKLLISALLICLVQIIASLKLDDETNEKISNLVGANQLALQSYLAGVKLETQKFEYNIRNGVSDAKNSLKTEVDKITNSIKSDTGVKPDQKPCLDLMNHKIEEITQQSETIHTNCVSSAKPNRAAYQREFTKYAEFQTKTGQVPKHCIDTNTDIASILKCIEKGANDIAVEMKNTETHLNAEIEKIKIHMNDFESTLSSCQNKGLEELKNKSNEIKEKLNQCVKA